MSEERAARWLGGLALGAVWLLGLYDCMGPK